jgi:hypothetical protein
VRPTGGDGLCDRDHALIYFVGHVPDLRSRPRVAWVSSLRLRLRDSLRIEDARDHSTRSCARKKASTHGRWLNLLNHQDTMVQVFDFDPIFNEFLKFIINNLLQMPIVFNRSYKLRRSVLLRTSPVVGCFRSVFYFLIHLEIKLNFLQKSSQIAN